MKKFMLMRVMQYTERLEIKAESWDEAKKILLESDIEFDRINDDTMVDQNIEFLGDIATEGNKDA